MPQRRLERSASRCLRPPAARSSRRGPPRSRRVLPVSSSLGRRSISCTSPSMRRRTKPCARSSSKSSSCSPLRPTTSGASTMTRVPSGKRGHVVDHLRDALRRERHVVLGAERVAHAREEQAQVVVDLGDRADGRARVVRGRLLLDRDRRRQALDQVDVGLLHELQELARVGRQRLDVAALPFGVERVEGERGLARTREPRDHDEAVARDVEADIAQVVRARAADADRFHSGDLLIYMSLLFLSTPRRRELPRPHEPARAAGQPFAGRRLRAADVRHVRHPAGAGAVGGGPPGLDADPRGHRARRLRPHAGPAADAVRVALRPLAAASP